MTDYTDTTIIECNNQSSSEVRAGNLSSPASYTNKLDNSLLLKRGDKVSVDYCFVNERGCGTPNAVEIKGVSLDQNKSWFILKKQEEGIEPVHVRTRMDTSLIQTYTPELITKSLRDDVAYVETNYYKETNCEGYYFLPRRFAYSPLPTTSPDKVAVGNANLENIYEGLTYTTGTALTTIKSNSNLWWDAVDDFTGGRCFNETGYQEGDDVFSICGADYSLYFNSASSKGYYRQRNDGTRFTIICRDIMIQDKGYNTATTEYWDNNIRDPAIGVYNIYNELIELSLPVGFNSPENIATRLTEQLQQTQEEELYTLEDNGYPKTERIWTSTIATNTFKPFNCGWYGGNGKTQYDAYTTDDGSGHIDALNYDASYQFLGVKRPDLFIAGRSTMTDGTEQIFIKNDINYGGLGNNVLSEMVTGWEYNKPNLEALSNLFKTQGRYPELWENNPIVLGTDYTIDNTRFLHINRYENTTGAIGNMLGYDNYETKGDGKNRASMPFFFYYDKKREDVYNEGSEVSNLSHGFATKQKEILGDGTIKYWIVLHPELSNGLRPYVFKYNVNILQNTTLIGWDHHFNSYGNTIIQLYSGYQDFSYDNTYNYGIASELYNDTGETTPINEGRFLPSVRTARLLSRMYLGANNPSVVYDATSHFGFKDLHTPENVGQPYNAGENADNEADNATASTICYKMNKRLNYWTYTPEMKPYKVGVSSAYGVVPNALTGAEIENNAHTLGADEPITSGQVKEVDHVDHVIAWGKEDYSKLNEAITPYTIMDAHGGISLNVGASYTSDSFNDGLFGLLGFTFKQTNPTTIDNTNNRVARITNTNLYNLEWITTNAQIVETQIQNFVVNRYGAIQFSSQVPTPLLLEGWVNQLPGTQGGTSAKPARISGYTIYPPIVETTQSIVVFGELLPRRMVRPYYCIRSDLVLHERQKYVGGKDSGDKLPIIAVVNKENGDGDYFFSVDSPIQFTITNDINVSSIKTSIHDPDQSLASVGDGCCVIYRIERNKVLDNSIIDEILNKKMKK